MVIDFHSHVLPGIDDGSASVEESIAMLRMESEQGISRVVATPHFYAQYNTPERFLEQRDLAEARLREEMAQHGGLPELLVGAEVYFFRGMSDSQFLPQLTIRGKHCILIEMPPAPWTDSVFQELESIWKKQRIVPIVAHVDRYISPFKTYDIPRKLAELPVLVQANADFFLKRATVGMALKMLKADRIQLLGSDCHNVSSRKPDLLAAVQKIEQRLGKDVLAGIRGYECAVLEEEVVSL